MDGRFRRAFRLTRGPQADAHDVVDEELAFHLEECVEELVSQGWDRERAREEATRRFGDLEDARSYCVDMQTRRGREEGRAMALEAMTQDLKYAARTLMRAPTYSALVVVTLAFGIAANTTVFSLMNPYLFRPLPFDDPDGLVHVTQVDPVSGSAMDRFSLPMYEDWRERVQGLEDLAAYYYGGVNLTGPEGAESVVAGTVTANMFDVLGVSAASGRTFRPDEGGPGGPNVILLDHGLWNRRYAADPGIIGRSVTVDGVPHTVVGVMPPDFVFPFGGVRIWRPERSDPLTADRERTPYLFVGRLRDGVTRAAVTAELTAVQRELAGLHPDVDGQWSAVTVLPMRQALNFVWEILTVSFAILLGAVAFVLAIACVNVAGLTLARGRTRMQEVAIRSALGAGRRRIVRQLLTESTVLALAGGAAGVGLAYLAAAAIGPLIPEDLYKVGSVSIDGRVLGFSVAVTLLTPLLFGLAPALALTRRSLSAGLRDGGRGTDGSAAGRGRRLLVTVQVALAVMLTAGAGLMVRSFAAVQGQDLGFDAARTLAVEVHPPASSYPGEEARMYAQEAVATLQGLASVEAASATLFIPLNHETALWRYVPSGSSAPGEEWPTAQANRPYPGYFDAMGIPVLAGRDFHASDGEGGEQVVIVNRTLADRHWPEGGAVGRILLAGDPDDPTPLRVVGVVGDVRHDGLTGDAVPQMYRPALQSSFRRHFLVARIRGRASEAVADVRSALTTLDGGLPLTIRPMDDVVRENQLQWSLGSLFLAIFGGGAFLLAALGVYGLVAFGVTQRRRELGVRMALGASRAQVRRAVLGEGVRATAAGMGIGLAGALMLGRLMESVLYGVTGFDPLTLAGVLLLFLAASVAASLAPAQRASRTDPMRALRAE